MVSIPLHPGTGRSHAGDRLLRRLYLELKKSGKFTARRKGATLFRQGGRPRGAFLLTRGQARLWMSSRRGTPLGFHLISAPCVLGLPATVSSHPYNFTAVLTEDAQVACLQRQTILKVLHKHQGFALCVVELLSHGMSELMARHKQDVLRKSPQKARSAMPVSTALRR
jgi:CRP-like cAMP-binding protein